MKLTKQTPSLKTNDPCIYFAEVLWASSLPKIRVKMNSPYQVAWIISWLESNHFRGFEKKPRRFFFQKSDLNWPFSHSNTLESHIT